MKHNLTQAYVSGIEPPQAGRLSIRDGKSPGLVLSVTPTGSKSYYLYKWADGKPRRILLGHHPMMTVEAARDAAVKACAKLVDGIDLAAEKRARRSGGVTLGDVFEHFTAKRLDTHCAPSTATTHKSRYETCLSQWKGRRLDSIRREEVQELHHRLGKQRGHTTANRAIQLLRSLFNYATSQMNVTTANPAARIELYPETARDRFLRADELPKFFAAVADEPDETMRDFFVVALFTGARRGNVQSMRWAEVDFDSATWVVPAEKFKTHKPMHVVLSAQVLEVLRRRHKFRDGPYVFPSYGKRGHLVEPKGAWERLRERSGLADLRIHDLRRTLGSWQAAAGTSLVIIGKSLGHTQPSTTAIYARLDLDAVRESVASASAAIAEAGMKKTKKGAK